MSKSDSLCMAHHTESATSQEVEIDRSPLKSSFCQPNVIVAPGERVSPCLDEEDQPTTNTSTRAK